MEFKKRKEKEFIDPLEKCKVIFKEGVTFNNGNLLDRKQESLLIESVLNFEIGEDEIHMNFGTHGTTGFKYTVWKDGKFADIIK